MSNPHYLSPSPEDNMPPTTSEDVVMTPDSARSEEDDSMPDFMEFSDASDSSESGSALSAADAHEIVMQAQDSERDSEVSGPSYEPPSESTSNPAISPSRPASQRSSNRRARVEDDEDEERDRRHPSQRISNRFPDSSFTSQTSSSAPSPLQSQPPTRPQTARIRTTFTIPSLARLGIDQTDPLRFFQHLIPQSQPQQNNNTQNVANDTTTPNTNSTTPQPPPPSHANGAPDAPPTQQTQPHGGFTLIVPLAGVGLLPPLRIIPHLGNAHTTLSGNENDNEQADFQMFSEMLLRLGILGATFGGFPEPDVDDPERARKLVNGLEEVPIGLVRRLERVGGTSDEDGGRDTMCAICWDQLLDDAGFGDHESKVNSDRTNIPKSTVSSESLHPESTSSSGSSPQSTEEADESKHPKISEIVALPCAHVFHAECLIPWFSRPRQTTCPTCRFNIDPENLTRSRRRRSSPRMPAGPPPNVPQPAPNNDQAGRQHTTAAGNVDNTNIQGNETPNRLPGQFMFDQVRIPILVSGQSLFPPGSGVDGTPSREMIDQLRASVEERLRARSGQPPNGSNLGSNNDTSDPGLDDPTLPPLEPTSPQTTGASTSHTNSPAQPTAPTRPRSSSQPNTRAGPADGHAVTHSIVFGFDVFVGGPVTGPLPEGNAMDIDDGVGNDGNDRNWMGTMRDIFGGRGEPGTGAPGDNNVQRNGNNANDGQANPGTGGGTGQGRAPAEGFPQFLNMNLGNGESLHIASGSGRTMGEAMAQLFSGMGMPAAGNDAPTNDNDGQGQNAAPDAGTNPNAPTQENGNPSQNETPETDDRENQGSGEGGMFGAIGMTPLQFMTQMLGFAQPWTRRRSNQNQNQPSGEAATANSAAAEATQAPQAESATPNTNNVQQPEQGATPRPTPGNNTNDDNSFSRFMRQLAGNLPTGATGTQEENQHMHFFPAGFTIPGFPVGGDAPGPIPTNARQSEKKPWVPPPAPGLTLRQRIEKKEREAGLRCYDVSCGVGPSDEDPLNSVTADEMKQLRLCLDGSTCQHTFHRSCLVSTERVALRGADAPVVGDHVEVSCSVCRAVGRVSKNDWEEGVQQLS